MFSHYNHDCAFSRFLEISSMLYAFFVYYSKVFKKMIYFRMSNLVVGMALSNKRLGKYGSSSKKGNCSF